MMNYTLQEKPGWSLTACGKTLYCIEMPSFSEQVSRFSKYVANKLDLYTLTTKKAPKDSHVITKIDGRYSISINGVIVFDPAVGHVKTKITPQMNAKYIVTGPII